MTEDEQQEMTRYSISVDQFFFPNKDAEKKHETAAEKNISAQLVMQNYMLERLLERISLSKYKHHFIPCEAVHR